MIDCLNYWVPVLYFKCTACNNKRTTLATKLYDELEGVRDVVQRRATVRWKVETLLYGARAPTWRAHPPGTRYVHTQQAQKRKFFVMCLLCATCVHIHLRHIVGGGAESRHPELSNALSHAKFGRF